MKLRKTMKRSLLLLLTLIVFFSVAVNETYAALPDGATTRTNSYTTSSGDGTITLSWPSKIFLGDDLPLTISVSSGDDVNYLDSIKLEEWALGNYIIRSIDVSSFNGGGTLQAGDSATYYVDVENVAKTNVSLSLTEYTYSYKFINPEDFPNYANAMETDSVSETITFDVVSDDTTPPVISGGSYYYSDVEHPASLADIKAELSASDETDGNLTNFIVNVTDNYSSNADTLGEYLTRWKVTDNAGNIGYKNVYVRVVDIDDPVITLSGSSTVYIEYGGSYSEPGYSVSDNYDTSLSVTVTGSINTNVLGTYYKYYNASDSSGNDATEKRRTIIVRDTTKPTISINGSSTVYVEIGDSYSDAGASWSDNYDGSGTANASGSVDTNTLGSYTITYTYTDSSGNSATSKTRTVIVEDTTAPTLSLNGDSTVYIKYGGVYSELGAVYSDNVDGTGAANVSGTVDTSTLGSYTITYSYTDSSGNTASTITRTVIVEDQSKPILSLNGDATIYVEHGGVYSELGAIFNDNVDGTGAANVSGTVDTSILGSYTITYSYTDANGNVADEITRTVIVEDTTKPTIILIGDPTIYVEYGQAYNEEGASWTDNVDGTGTANVSGTVDTSILGSYNITYTYTDANGNVANEVTRTVIVEDTTSPYVEGNLSTITTYNSLDKSLAELTANIKVLDHYDGDLSSSYIFTTDEYSSSNNIVGSYNRTISVSDSNGNTMTHSFVIDIEDDLAPIISGSSYLLTETEANSMTQEQIKSHIASKE